MKRASSLRTHNLRGSVSPVTDDLGAVREESVEDVLRRDLLTAERENDKLKAQILSLQDQLSQRPPIEQINELEREYKNLELLLIGTQRENERCMAELERLKTREKILERELIKLAGEDWQSTLNIPSSNTSGGGRNTLLRPGDTTSFFLPQAESTVAGSMGALFDTSVPSSLLQDGEDSPVRATPKSNTNPPAPANAQTLNTTLAHIAQVRALILGMEERMQIRENRYTQEIARAEGEARRFEAVRKGIDSIS